MRHAIPSLILATALAVQGTHAQAPAVIAGQVSDSSGRVIPGVTVRVVQLRRAALTDEAGRFRLTGIPAGTYTLSLARLGYAPELRQVTTGPASGTLNVRMRESRIALAAVQVTATPAATLARESPQPIAVLEGPALRVAQGAALGETLELVPGVRSLSMTTGIGKPVIRGMTHYRVVTLDNGQRTETQAWGHDHSPNVETATAERVEVIKGPSSVLYGSDALGGVVNVVAPAVPDAIDAGAFIRGKLSTAYNHNVRGGDGTLLLEGARGGLGARASVTMRGSGNMRTPAGALQNTDNAALALDGAAAWRWRRASATARYTTRDERIEIFDDPALNPTYDGFQRIATHRGQLELVVPGPLGTVETTVGFEENFRREFASATAAEPDLGLHVRNWTATLHLGHARGKALSGTIGAFAMTSAFENRGSKTLIPSSATANVAVYAFEQLDLDRWKFSGGLRYDYRTLSTEGDPGIGVPEQARSFPAVTGSLGALFRVTEPLALVVNIARGFRAPAAPDLFANGFHEGTRAFERGDPRLDVETSLNTEAGVRYASSTLAAEVTGYVNSVDDYIYLRPFGTGARAFDSLQVVQGDARLAGIEVAAQWQPTRVLAFNASGDYVRGDNHTAGVPLTLIPPLRVVYGMKLQSADDRGSIRGRYLSLNAESNARQSRLDPRDVSTPGYTLVNLAAGLVALVPSGPFTLDVAVRNILDVRYRSFMSRYKEYAFGPGRAVSLRMSIGF